MNLLSKLRAMLLLGLAATTAAAQTEPTPAIVSNTVDFWGVVRLTVGKPVSPGAYRFFIADENDPSKTPLPIEPAKFSTRRVPPGMSVQAGKDATTGLWSAELTGTPTTLGRNFPYLIAEQADGSMFYIMFEVDVRPDTTIASFTGRYEGLIDAVADVNGNTGGRLALTVVNGAVTGTLTHRHATYAFSSRDCVLTADGQLKISPPRLPFHVEGKFEPDSESGEFALTGHLQSASDEDVLADVRCDKATAFSASLPNVAAGPAPYLVTYRDAEISSFSWMDVSTPSLLSFTVGTNGTVTSTFYPPTGGTPVTGTAFLVRTSSSGKTSLFNSHFIVPDGASKGTFQTSIIIYENGTIDAQGFWTSAVGAQPIYYSSIYGSRLLPTADTDMLGYELTPELEDAHIGLTTPTMQPLLDGEIGIAAKAIIDQDADISALRVVRNAKTGIISGSFNGLDANNKWFPVTFRAFPVPGGGAIGQRSGAVGKRGGILFLAEY
jgi:hypothetical protein